MLIGPFEYARRVEERRDRLYRIAYCYVKNQDDALDIVSEAVYRGYVRLGQLHKEDAFDAWMKRIVVNAALDFLRKRNRCPVSTDELLPEVPADETGLTPDEHMDLYAGLDLLTPEERSYIILRFFEELSFPEMAKILMLPETTVKSRLYRILKKLREYLSHEEVTP